MQDMIDLFMIVGLLVFFGLVFYPDVPSWIRHLSSFSRAVALCLLELLRAATEMLSDVIFVVRMVTSARPTAGGVITGHSSAGVSEVYSDK